MKHSRRKVAEKAIELLEKVHDLIRDRDGWTRAAFARDGDGRTTEPGSRELARSVWWARSRTSARRSTRLRSRATARWTRGWPPPIWSVRGSRAPGQSWTA